MKTNLIRILLTTALITAAAAVTPLSSAAAGEVPHKQQVIFYDYLTEQLLPQYGYATRAELEETVTSDEVTTGEGSKLCWDQRRGLVSANILDMNEDGTPEMLVTYFGEDSEREYGGRHPSVMYGSRYTMDPSLTQVVPVNTVELFSTTNVAFLNVSAGIMNVKGRPCFVVENIGNAYFADGAGASFTYYIYDGSRLRELYMIGKTDGGSDEIAYKLVRTKSDGSTSSRLLWADESYMYYYPDVAPEVSWQDGDTGDGMEAGFRLLELGECNRVRIENSSWTMYYPEADDLYPTYYTTSAMEKAFQYRVCGPREDGWSVRHLSATLEERTKLKDHIEYRGYSVADYVDRPGGAAEAAAAEAPPAVRPDADGARQIFPDSSDRLLTNADVSGKSWDDLRQGINEIYARHGYIFKTPEILQFFRKFGWYEEKYTDQNTVHGLFNNTEKENVKFLDQFVNKQPTPGAAKPKTDNTQIVG